MAVSPARPCPVCGGVGGCGVAPEEGYAACLVVRSRRPLAVGGWLHRVAPAGPEPEPVPAGGAGAAAPLVLVVEDDAVVGELLRMVLEDEGYAVAWCRTAADAVRAVRARRPRAVVLDLRLPDGRGEGLLRRFKADPATFAAPVAVLSAAARELGPDQAQRADGVLEKPVDAGALLAAPARTAPPRPTG